jgi:hypothetical protein
VKKSIRKRAIFLNTLSPEYNLLPIAGNSAGNRHTAEAREKIKVISPNLVIIWLILTKEEVNQLKLLI